MDFGSLFLYLVLILNLSMMAACPPGWLPPPFVQETSVVTGVIAAKAGVIIDGASTASASADATAMVGMPIFLMLFDIFPRLLSAHNVNTRCGTIR